MAAADNSIRVPLTLQAAPASLPNRRGEPITIGVPLPPGAARSTDDLWIEGNDGIVRPGQVTALDHWPDESIRWALLDVPVDLDSGALVPLFLCGGGGAPGPSRPVPGALTVAEGAHGVDVRTPVAEFAVRIGEAFPLASVLVDGRPALDGAATGFRLSHLGVETRFVVRSVRVVSRGPQRVELDVRAGPVVPAAPVEVSGRIHLFAGTGIARVSITVRNPRAARHPGGIWELGDPGSVLLDEASLVLGLRSAADRAEVQTEPDAGWRRAALPLEIYQDSSGGPFWNSPAHINREGRVPVRFRGYQMRTGETVSEGQHASPIVRVDAEGIPMAVAVPEFWQNCPRSIRVDERRVEIGYFPRQFDDVHELQGGEQKTHVAVLAFGADSVSDPPLGWVHDPLRVHVPSAWSCATGAIPYLETADRDHEPYRELIALAFDGERGFAAKQQRFDEFGWRHFGDLPGDHESAFQPADRPFVSHYNNQYDAVAAGALHFLRSGDPRWWRLMDELARHVRDVDIYHTREDRAAYSGGLFWHTEHYVDAGRSTHRTYARGSGGGGPSCEHNYATGLMLHYFLTGDEGSREAVVGLGRWVIDMDDGERAPFRWLARGRTGLASATGSPDYHGPGRGSANSIVACLAAARLSGDPVFEKKVEELIRRCIHPGDDLARRNLLDVERRWYYTVFLQALGQYLHEKIERGENDEMYAYARASLLHYARWMLDHEVPYLTRPEVLQYPTETWAAQDLRKAEVFWWAALHAPSGERDRFVERARYFFDEAVATLNASPTGHFTRPLVLALRNGVHVSWFEAHPSAAAPPAACDVDERHAPPAFVPQKARAMRRARTLAIGAGVVLAVLVGLVAAAWS